LYWFVVQMINIKKFLGGIISGAIFIICIYYIVCYFQWRVIFQLLTQVDLRWFLGAGIGTILLYWIIRTMRWCVLLIAVNIHIDFYRLYLVGAISMALAVITPLQFGEALKIELLKKVGVLDRMPGYGIFMTEKILDLTVVLLMAIVSLLLGFSNSLGRGSILTAVVMLLICLNIFLTIVKRISPNTLVGRFFQPFSQCVRSPKVLVSVVLLTIGGWLLVAIGWYVSLRSISILLTLSETTALTAITTLISFLSLIPGALGISEVSISSFLVYLKQDVPVAQAGALIIRTFGIMVLIIGSAHFLSWKLICMRKHTPVSTD
jgi:uncharacterized membrane protein YbhN (UPF0104 family)